MKEDVASLFADDSNISEDFKAKAATIFEARVFDRVAQIQEQLEAEYAGQLEEAVNDIRDELTEKVDDYLNYAVVEQWMQENEIAIESGLRSEITEDFIAGLRHLFAENYINVPEDKVDLVDELASKVEELEVKLNEEIEANIQYKKQLTEAIKVQLVNEVCEGLTATQVEKIKALAESVELSTEEEFTGKLETIRENYFPSGVKKAKASQLHEEVEDDGTEKKVAADPYVASVQGPELCSRRPEYREGGLEGRFTRREDPRRAMVIGGGRGRCGAGTGWRRHMVAQLAQARARGRGRTTGEPRVA